MATIEIDLNFEDRFTAAVSAALIAGGANAAELFQPRYQPLAPNPPEPRLEIVALYKGVLLGPQKAGTLTRIDWNSHHIHLELAYFTNGAAGPGTHGLYLNHCREIITTVTELQMLNESAPGVPESYQIRKSQPIESKYSEQMGVLKTVDIYSVDFSQVFELPD